MKRFVRKRARLFIQILFWFGVISTSSLLFIDFVAVEVMAFRNIFLLTNIIFLLVANIYWLVPRFFIPQKYGWYTLSLVLLIGLLILIVIPIEWITFSTFTNQMEPFQKFSYEPMDGLPKRMIRPPLPWQFPALFMKAVIYTTTMMVSTVIESIQIHLKQSRLSDQIRNEKLETEMKFLKSQINPHFLFNTLNNIYAMAWIKSDRTPEIVMKLSEMLRYMLYNVNQDYVSLSDEIQYIRHFIDLYNLKDDQNGQIYLDFGPHKQDAKIAPMMLIPFVENAFKHGQIEDLRHGWIKMTIKSEQHWLLFHIANSVPKQVYTKDKVGGIGLGNVRRRLELQYPNLHQLNILNNQNVFEVNLKLALQ